MLQLLLIRPGSTDMDEQGRIKGSLDLPLSEHGKQQAARTADELADVKIDHLYTAPCQSCLQTANTVAARHRLKVRTLDTVQNLDHGLWHGKLLDELKQTQPKVFRQLQEHPETVVPPGGEPVAEAVNRVTETLRTLSKKHRTGVVGVVVSEPMATLVRCAVERCELGDLASAECECGGWKLLPMNGGPATTHGRNVPPPVPTAR
jgi:broad specificity phosphatase PhoE